MRPQKMLIDRIAAFLDADPRVRGAWLSGSLGRGTGDEWSDVDILVIAADDGLDEVFAAIAANVGAIVEIVYAKAIFGRVINAITPAWERFDLAFATETELASRDPRDLEMLFQKSPSRPSLAAGARAEPDRLEQNIEEFLRVLGLAPVAFGRGEYMLVLEGLGLLRAMLIDVMLEENAVTRSDRGGHLKLNAFLTGAQRAELEASAPQGLGRDTLIAANGALARSFLPRARALAACRALAWPQAFEDATRARLASALGLMI